MSEQEQATTANLAARLEVLKSKMKPNTLAEAVYRLALERFEHGHLEAAGELLKQIGC